MKPCRSYWKECKKENLVKIASFEKKISVYEENIRHLSQRYDRDIAEQFREVEIKSKELEDISKGKKLSVGHH